MIYLRSVRLRREDVSDFSQYPFSIPAVRDLDELTFPAPVVFFTGENGSGKSTILEAVAVAWGFNAEGGSRNFRFATRRTESGLHEYLALTRGPVRPRDGYFVRAESLYNVATHIEELDEEPAFSPPVAQSYGGSLHERSHGESFLSLLQNRLGGRGLYLFDEPEAALSAQRQLSMLCEMDELVKRGSQLILATHSPILLAYPGAAIYAFSEGGARRVPYAETDAYKVTKSFLDDPARTLEHLGIADV